MTPMNRNCTWFVYVATLLIAPLSVVAEAIPPDPPSTVAGKEYSNHRDQDFAGVPDEHQNIQWDGLGGAVDTFDFTDALFPIEVFGEVDALANRQDNLYFRVSHEDSTTMVASMSGIGEIYYTASVHHAPVHNNAPNVGVWATAFDINAGSLPDDVDALEVWGPADMDDAQKFSLIGDPESMAGLGVGRVSVWNYTPGANATPYILAAEIANAIGRPELENEIDVDAMMVFDQAEFPGVEIEDTFDDGDSIMFSIAPIADFDGGEVWVWDKGAGMANYLEHGGETWDTAHSVIDHFGAVNSENINALEAIPEPASGVMLLLGIAAVLVGTRRRAKG